MDAARLPLALFALFGFVALAPAWMYYLDEFAPGLPSEASFLAGLVLPATAALYLASWLQP